MRFINSKTHGILDYLWGILIIMAPWLFDFADGSAAQIVPQVAGVLILVMSLVTNYELGVKKVVPLSTHLTMDVIMGAFLALSPWIFGFADQIIWPHLLFGLFSIGAGLFTKKVPDYNVAN